METIGESLKKAINFNFRYTLIERSKDGIISALNVGVKGSNNMCVLPNIEYASLERIDDTHDKLLLSWSDYQTEGIVTWKPSTNKATKSMVFYGIE